MFKRYFLVPTIFSILSFVFLFFLIIVYVFVQHARQQADRQAMIQRIETERHSALMSFEQLTREYETRTQQERQRIQQNIDAQRVELEQANAEHDRLSEKLKTAEDALSALSAQPAGPQESFAQSRAPMEERIQQLSKAQEAQKGKMSDLRRALEDAQGSLQQLEQDKAREMERYAREREDRFKTLEEQNQSELRSIVRQTHFFHIKVLVLSIIALVIIPGFVWFATAIMDALLVFLIRAAEKRA